MRWSGWPNRSWTKSRYPRAQKFLRSERSLRSKGMPSPTTGRSSWTKAIASNTTSRWRAGLITVSLAMAWGRAPTLQKKPARKAISNTMPDDPHQTQSEYLLQLKHVSKSYGGLRALNDVNVGIRYAEIYWFVGQKGSGKSTFIKIISGVEQADLGENLFHH